MPSSSSRPEGGRRRVVDAAGGGGIAVLLVWGLDLAGVPLTPAAAAVLAGLIATAAAALGRDGIRGLARRLWRGVNGDDPPSSSSGADGGVS